MSENTTFKCCQLNGVALTAILMVPVAYVPSDATATIASSAATARANARRGLTAVLLRMMILRAGYIDSRCLSTSITKTSRLGHRRSHPERLVHVVNRLPRTALVVRLDEDLSALVQGQLGLAFEDEHHLDVADAPTRPPQPFRCAGKVHARRLL